MQLRSMHSSNCQLDMSQTVHLQGTRLRHGALLLLGMCGWRLAGQHPALKAAMTLLLLPTHWCRHWKAA